MKRYDAVIVGAGHNPLVTAALLARKGRRVLVLERREVLGGAAATEEIFPGCRVNIAAQDTGPQPWLHVQVTGEDDGAENVAVNVPLSAAEPLLALVPHRILSDGQLSLAGRELPINVGAMRDLWRALMEVGDTEFVAVDGDDETVRIARVGDQITVQVEDRDEEGDETVDIQLPIVVVDALLSGNGDALDVRAAVERLGELRGDIVRVTEDERQVRIWIDEVATQ